MPATIRFDFTHYLPSQNPNDTIVRLASGQCIPNNFVIACICTDLVPGKEYQITYQLLNPSSNPGNPINIFNPNTQNIFASFSTQKFATLADLEVQGEYILQATLKDIADDIRTSSVISLRCGEPSVPTPTPTNTPTITPSRFSRQNNITVSIVDPDLDPISDNIISLGAGVFEFPLVGLANNTIIGSKYAYEFFDVPEQSVSFEKKSGEFYSGSFIQNFNSKIALSGSPKFVYIYASVTDIENNITKYSEPTLMKYLGNGLECSTILPSGINLKMNAPVFRTCNARGITTDTISFISGGTNFSIGDKFTTVGGGGIGAELQMVSGGITKDSFSSFYGGTGFKIGDFLEVTGGEGSGGLIQITSGAITLDSITSLTGSLGFKVGDLLTTVGGGGSGAVIRVTSVDPVTGAITGFEVLNGGSGYTFAPSGLVAITDHGVVTNVLFNADNFGIPAAGGITQDSVALSGGTGYNIGEILNIVGGGGVGAQILIISGALTASSINNLSGGTGYVVGDYLTTIGGNGEGVVIRVKCVNGSGAIANCPDGSPGWEIINGGYGFTSAPTGFIKLTGSGTGGTLVANSDNFAIPDAGQITRESISGLIGSGTGYKAGDRLIVSGGGGNGGLILITSVGPAGQILSYVILDGGAGYDSAPVLLNESGNRILNQPVWNISKFTDPGFVVINSGNGYYSAPTLLVSENGNGSGASATYDVEQFTNYAFDVINSGSGYTSAPTGLKVITGNGSDFTVSFNANHFTIPPTGGLTPESVTMVGGTGYNIGDKISIQGGDGSGGVIQVVSGSLTEQSINSIVGGSGYAVGDLLTTVGGDGKGVVIRIKCVDIHGSIITCLDGSAGWELVNAGYGFTGAPTGLVVLSGHGTGASLSANADNFAFTQVGGLTERALDISGGTGYNIGDKFNISGANGSGGLIEVISGSLSTQSINNLAGGSGYHVGDLLTTVGGDGKGVVIRVKCVGAVSSKLGVARSNGTSTFTGLGSVASPYFRATRVLNTTSDGLMQDGTTRGYSFTATASGKAYVSCTFYDDNNDNNYGYIKKNGLQQQGTIINDGVTVTTRSFPVVSGDVITFWSDNYNTSFSNVSIWVDAGGPIVNCPDGSPGWELVNGGYGFTGAPTALVVLTGTGSGATLTANADNFSLTKANGITNDSLDLFGGTGYNVGDKITIGGGNSSATIQIISGGITTDTFSKLSGGTGYNIGDYISVTGGDGHDGVIQIISGSLTSSSINSLIGGTGYSVGDLLTTTGGNGQGVVIRVKCVNVNGSIANCPDGSPGWEIINGGYGFTDAPTALVAITGIGRGASLSANPDNFSITAAGGITPDSVKISGGNGYNVGEILDISGGGGTGAKIQIISGSLTASSINSLIGGTGYAVGDLLTTAGGNGQGVVIRVKCVNGNGAIANCSDGSPGWEIINGGYGFTGAPTSLVILTGSGSGANITANANNFSITAVGGITANSIKVSGGNGYNIGEVLDVVGGGGTGAKIQITSGSLTSDSINSLLGGTGYAVGDLLTTTGGNGQGVVIKIKCVNVSGAITTCPDGSPGWEIVNGGYGFTGAPTGLVVLTGSGSGASISANSNNFSITPEGQITTSSISNLINTGTGYRVGDRIYVQGGNGSGAVIQITSVSNTGVILSYVILDGGSGYSSAPILANASGTAIVPQPSWNVSNFTKSSFVIISQGSGYTSSPDLLVSENGNGTGAISTYNTNSFTKPAFVIINQGSGYTTAPNLLTSENGDGSGAVTAYNVDNFTDLAFTVVNAGYGYTSAPTGLSNITGNGSGASVEFNENNFSLIRSGGITKDSISGLIGSSNVPPFTVGSKLYITGGGGSGATIVVTSVDGQGRILDYIIVDSGYGYDGSSAFVVKTGSINGAILNSQPVFDITKFTTDSFVILDSGAGFENGRISISNLTGNGFGLAKTLDVDQLTKDSFVILDQGSGYLGNAPISLSSVNGSNGNGAATALDKELTTQRSFVIIDSGSGYTTEPTRLSNITGNGNGVSSYFDVTKFSAPAIIVTNPGYGFLDSPTGLQVLTGYGSLSTLTTEFNDNHFSEISGPLPTPTPTPTITLTPTQSKPVPVPCNDLQSAGGQNDIYIGKVARSAPSGQRFLICEDSPALKNYTVVVGAGIPNDTNIIAVENYYQSVDDQSGFKKITLNRPITGNVLVNQEIKLITVDIRLIKTSYSPGMMTFTYDAYSVPDRFRVIGIPVDVSKPELLLFDSGFRGDQGSICANSYVRDLSGSGAGYVDILKPDGMIYIRVIVEAPCEGTAWQYLLSCPVMLPPISITPTPTLTNSPTPTLTKSPTPTRSA